MAKLKASYSEEVWAQMGAEQRRVALVAMEEMDEVMGAEPQQQSSVARLKAAYGGRAWEQLSEAQRERALRALQRMEEAMGVRAEQPVRSEAELPRTAAQGQMRDTDAATGLHDYRARLRLEVASVQALVDQDDLGVGVPPAHPAPRAGAKASEQKPKKPKRTLKKATTPRSSRPTPVSAGDYETGVEFVRQAHAEVHPDIVVARQKLRSLSYSMSGEDPARLFKIFDRNNSGAIDLQEFRAGMRKGGKITHNAMDDEAIEMLFWEMGARAMDEYGNGELGIDELTNFVWPGDAFKMEAAAKEAERLSPRRQGVLNEVGARAETFMTTVGGAPAIQTIYPHRSLSAEGISPGLEQFMRRMVTSEYDATAGSEDTVGDYRLGNLSHAAGVQFGRHGQNSESLEFLHRLATPSTENSKTLALKAKLQEEHEEMLSRELTFSPQLNHNSVNMVNKRNVSTRTAVRFGEGGVAEAIDKLDANPSVTGSATNSLRNAPETTKPEAKIAVSAAKAKIIEMFTEVEQHFAKLRTIPPAPTFDPAPEPARLELASEPETTGPDKECRVIPQAEDNALFPAGVPAMGSPTHQAASVVVAGFDDLVAQLGDIDIDPATLQDSSNAVQIVAEKSTQGQHGIEPEPDLEPLGSAHGND